MKRVAIAIAGLWIALAQQPAAAHARASGAQDARDSKDANTPAMCGDASQPFVFGANAFAAVHLSRADHADTDAPAEPGEATALQLAAAAILLPVPAQAASPLPMPADETPAWCVTPDDPRCSPRHASAPLQPPLLLAPPCDFETSRLPQLRSIEPAAVPPAAKVGAAQLGVRSRVERPPRSRS